MKWFYFFSSMGLLAYCVKCPISPPLSSEVQPLDNVLVDIITFDY